MECDAINASVHLYYAVLVYIRIIVPCTAPCPGQHEFFQVFEGSILKAPQVVLFHTTAIHCYNGVDDDNASFFVLGSELLVCPLF